MIAASEARASKLEEKLLRIDPERGTLTDGHIADLSTHLHAGDLLVVNDAAALPGSLQGRTVTGDDLELRLAGCDRAGKWRVALLGRGDWRTKTEDRPEPPRLTVGDVVDLGGGLAAHVTSVSSDSPRLVTVTFTPAGDAFWSALYRRGRAVQYAYTRRPLELWDVQTAYASRPVAAESPSAGRPLSWKLLLQLVRSGIRVATMTHAAGLSSIGDSALDSLLPFPESYDIPEATVRAIRSTRGRIVAVGTTVVRALEGSFQRHGWLEPGSGETDLLIGSGFRPHVVHGILSGMHEPGSSHFHLLEAFAPAELLTEAWNHAEREGYLCHEFGDSTLVLGG